MRYITNVRFPNPISIPNQNEYWSVSIDSNHKIVSIKPFNQSIDSLSEDWKGDWLSPRGIDLQINGGLGLSFNDLDLKDLPRLTLLLEQLWKDGIEAIAPTLVTCSRESLRKSLDILRELRENKVNNTCKILGAHIEGPFLHKNFRGIHQLKYLSKPSLSKLDEYINGYENEIALITLAPELPGSAEIIRRLTSLGITICLGHSAANTKESNIAFDEGVTMLTHVFNCMRGIHHRDPGPIGEALFNDKISMGVIADGFHVSPKVVVMLYKLASNQLILVSDALAAYGLDKEEFQWEGQTLLVQKGLCRLTDGTFAGTTLPLLEGCKRFASWTKDASAAIWSATISPRRVISKNISIENCLIGKKFQNLLRWHFDIQSNELTWRTAE